MDLTILLILAGIILLIIVLFLIALAKQYRKVGPNEALIIFGGRKRTVIEPDGTKRKIGYRIHIGGGTFIKPFIESAQVLPLDIFTLTIKTPEVLTAQGVSIIAEATAQVKVSGDDHAIRTAAEQFLSKGAEGIKDVAYQILEGCMRAVLGTMTVEQVYQQREEFSERVKKAASSDFSRMGLVVLSFALKDISDTQGYLEALSRPRIAQVKRDAAIAQAETDRDATIRSAMARKDGDIARLQAEIEISEANRNYEIKRAEFQARINQKKAQADLAYDLEKQRMLQQIKKEEYQVRLVEKEQGIKVEEKEIIRKEKELEASVKKAADARKYQIQAEAEAESYRLEAEARGRAQARKLEGLAEAELIKAQGEAEAEAMQKKAESWADYNQAAIYQMIIDKLPDLARAVSEPLSKVEKIIMVDGGGDGSLGVSRITQQVAQVLAQLPTVIESLSGLDMTRLLENLSTFKKEDKSDEKKSKANKDVQK
ncbi:MAG: SPFH domain-containing protein [candidate division KSB1 bacterium]|nr:SPFH domain-containing protein [candidate division KSB1 bacterium]